VKTWAWILLIGWTVLTAPLGFALIADDYFDLSLFGGIVLMAWLIGSTIILAVGVQGQPERYEVGNCPRCGREVAVGSPTCLGCGYNLVMSRPPS
jgi:hypothetical protein